MAPSAIFGWGFLLGIATHSLWPQADFAFRAYVILATGLVTLHASRFTRHFCVFSLLIIAMMVGILRFDLARPTLPPTLRAFDPSGFAYDHTTPRGWMADRRAHLTKKILSVIPGDEGQLLAGILYGERGLSRTVKDDVRRSGLSHLVAVSGANVTIILGAVMRILSPLRWSKRRRFVAITIGLVAFVLFVTPQPPVVRAAIMGWLMALAPVVGRLPDFRHLLLVAAVVFTMWRPEALLFDPSFALSFLAMIGLQTFGALVGEWIETKTTSRIMAELVGSTVGAMLLTTPYAMWAFGQLSLVGLISNVFAVPLVPLAMAMGALVLVIPLPPLVFVTSFLLQSILQVAQISANAPIGIWDEVIISPWFMIASYVAMFFVWVIHRKVFAHDSVSERTNKIRGMFFS